LRNNTAESSNFQNEENPLNKRVISTNTGPDIVLMLNNLKESVKPELNTNKLELFDVYKMANRSHSQYSEIEEGTEESNSAYQNASNRKRKSGRKSVNNFSMKLDQEDGYHQYDETIRK
jgi:hypothetical protein